MTERQAEKIANLVIGAAAIGAAIYVLRSPALRRAVWGAARNTLIAGVPAWLVAETRNGWAVAHGRDSHGWAEGANGPPQPAI